MNLPEFTTITLEERGPVLIVRLANPPVNAMTQQMFSELRTAFRGPARDPQFRAIVLSGGAAKHFGAGGDVAELRAVGSDPDDSKLITIRECYWAVMDCPVPVVAAVQGKALGGGAALASLCDIVYVEPLTEYGLPELNVGVVGGAGHLMRVLPQQVVRHMFLTAEGLGADRLVSLGAATQVVPRDELDNTAIGTAEKIAQFSSVTLRFAKRDLLVSEQSTLKTRYELEQQLTRELGNYADSYEAGSAFVERRAAQFRHDLTLREEAERPKKESPA